MALESVRWASFWAYRFATLDVNVESLVPLFRPSSFTLGRLERPDLPLEETSMVRRQLVPATGACLSVVVSICGTGSAQNDIRPPEEQVAASELAITEVSLR